MSRHPSPPKAHLRRIFALFLTLAVALAVAAAPTVVAPAPTASAAGRPNIILITTDDMAAGDLAFMPKTRQLLRDAGVQVAPFLSNHPMCCPARAEIMTGQYGQNNGVHHNTGPWGSYWSLRDKSENVGAWLERAGYRTGFVGKHLNQWEHRPYNQPGWSRFNPIVKGIYHPFDITMWHNGHPRRYNGTHTSDLVGGFTTDMIRDFSRSTAPFFIWASFVAPHGMSVKGTWGPPVPAVRHRSLYPVIQAPTLSDPAYQESDLSDKPGYVRNSPEVSPDKVNRWFRARIRSLKSVDDQVAAIVNTCRTTGELANTYIVFMSDNGFMLGEHRQIPVKNRPYEESLLVPFLVRGPGIPAGVVRHQLFGMVDVAPTCVDIANATPGRKLDGRSMLPTLRNASPGYSAYLIQGGSDTDPWWWRGTRSGSFTYVKYTDGFVELYDLAHDPHQLVNVAHDPAYADALAAADAQLQALRSCAGQSCLIGGSAAAPAG